MANDIENFHNLEERLRSLEDFAFNSIIVQMRLINKLIQLRRLLAAAGIRGDDWVTAGTRSDENWATDLDESFKMLDDAFVRLASAVGRPVSSDQS